MDPIIRKVVSFLNLTPELEEYDAVDEEIRKYIVFKGTNLWILVFAIVVASVGLNMNSTAVIIGAMLISPLMGPINGMGYSIATYDFELFRKAIKNFSFAVIAGLVTSFIYFSISPVSTAHSELLARTSPTIYDVLIALFGGLAGIVAMSSKQKGNVIPGVAIATALMPPLCTAGYGLATAQFNFFFGAIYLFTINTVFIALAAVWVSQLLKFPIRTIPDHSQKTKINRSITAIISIVLIPSIYFGFNLVQQEKFKLNIDKYIANVSLFEGNFLLKQEVSPKDRVVKLYYAGEGLPQVVKDRIIEKAKDFNVNDAKIIIEQGFSTSILSSKNDEVTALKDQIFFLENQLKNTTSKLDSIVLDQNRGSEILGEIKLLFPEIDKCLIAKSSMFDVNGHGTKEHLIVVLNIKGIVIGDDVKSKIMEWLKVRLKVDELLLFFV